MIARAGAGLAWTTLRTRETQRGRIPHPQVQMILDGRVTYRVGHRDRLVGTAGDLVFVPNDFELTLAREPGRYCNWIVPAPMLARALGDLRGAAGGHAVIPLVRIAASDAERRELEGLLDDLARSFDAEGMPDAMPLAAWLARALARSARIKRLSPTALARLRRLDAWLDVNLHGRVALADLCAVAGCGPRALQKLVAARFGLSPMGYVRQRRLALVREKLASERGTLVTDAALDVGLGHLGRIARTYRTMFGESPVDTRRRRGVRSEAAASGDRSR